MVLEVKIIDDVFPERVFTRVRDMLRRQAKNFPWTEEFGRYGINDFEWLPLKTYTQRLRDLAREIFDSETLEPSYSMFAHYETPKASLLKHKDNNACTYTLDICLYQNTPWSIWVEDKEYFLKENQALAFYGEDQEHWRENFPDPETNEVGQIFAHFVEPTHWFFKGKYDENLRGVM